MFMVTRINSEMNKSMYSVDMIEGEIPALTNQQTFALTFESAWQYVALQTSL